ncbi:MAG: UbiA family prenyltransferase [Paracoccaceae bacterium]
MSSQVESAPAGPAELRVSLDRDLLNGTLALEAFWQALRKDWRVLRYAPAAFAGLPGTAATLLEAGDGPQIETLPYDGQVVDRLKAAQAAGQRVVMTTAGTEAFAGRVAQHLGCIDAVEMSADRTALVPVAPTGPGAGLSRSLTVLRAMRPHQWVKNVLVFLPMIADHGLTPANIGWTLLAFLAFGLVASSVYVLNDLIDLPADRRHPTKCRRPFASGALPLSYGRWMLPGFLGAGLLLAALGGPGLFLVMVLYAILTTAYSMKLKGTLGADIIVLALLYTLRIIAGAAVTGIVLSMWLLSFSVFLFLSLAAVKRLSELVYIETEGGRGRAAGRAYTVEDRPVIAMIATSAGFLSVLVLALFIDSPEVSAKYARPEILWGLGLGLLFWISRTVLLAHRGLVDQDPVIFALSDRVSRLTAIFFALVFLAATLG